MSTRVVYKYEIPALETEYGLCDPKVVLVAPQHGSLFPLLWVEVTQGEMPNRSMLVHIVATGEPIPPGTEHFGSAVCGQLVWHVYGKIY